MNTLKYAVIVDLQNDFITGTLGNKKAENILKNVAMFIKDFDGDIIFTRDTHENNYLETNEGKHLPVEHCIKGTLGHQIHRSLLGWKDAKVVDKPTFGSFELKDVISDMIYFERRNELAGTPNAAFYDRMMDKDIEIHLCGTCTDICVVSNAMILKAAFPEAKIVVHKKLCAGLDKEGHEAALLIMQRCQIEVED